jgi:uncharacterized metal-binding protein
LKDLSTTKQAMAQEHCLSKKKAHSISEALKQLNAKEFEEEMENDLKLIRKSTKIEGEREARKTHINQLIDLIKKIQSRYGQC